MDKKKAVRFYTDNSILVALFLAGPIAGAILLYQNFKRSDELVKAKICLAGSIVIVCLILFLFLQIERYFPETNDSLIRLASHFFLFLLAYFFIKLNNSSYWPNNGQFDVKKVSVWGVAGASISGIIITLVLTLVFSFFIPPFKGDFVKIEENNGIVYFNENASQKQAYALGKLLTDSQYFYENQRRYAKLEVNDNNIHVILEIQEEVWDDNQLVEELYVMIANLEYLFSTKNATVTARSYNFSGYQDKLFKLEF